MDQFLLTPCRLKRTADFTDNLDRLNKVKDILFFENLFEGFSLYVLHREVKDAVFLADSIGLDNVGMSQLCSSPGLPEKTINVFFIAGKFIMKHLQCHRTVKRNLACQINNSHAAAA